ncbi:hypothetical protein DAEQUDRAFT_152471 [Daedalea quercina L-15889]|uniref:Uncharacterized protein n=1 Tax=Daedalea quercina L-15889 TaxID=1314783 RepID=A0A165RLW2_9APHY|nr:hypothetical protein DAEQUDRAFT_152471 [Daedalea quercina L-15889]
MTASPHPRSRTPIIDRPCGRPQSSMAPRRARGTQVPVRRARARRPCHPSSFQASAASYRIVSHPSQSHTRARRRELERARMTRTGRGRAMYSSRGSERPAAHYLPSPPRRVLSTPSPPRPDHPLDRAGPLSLLRDSEHTGYVVRASPDQTHQRLTHGARIGLANDRPTAPAAARPSARRPVTIPHYRGRCTAHDHGRSRGPAWPGVHCAVVLPGLAGVGYTASPCWPSAAGVFRAPEVRLRPGDVVRFLAC